MRLRRPAPTLVRQEPDHLPALVQNRQPRPGRDLAGDRRDLLDGRLGQRRCGLAEGEEESAKAAPPALRLYR